MAHQADATPGPADDARPNRAAGWWKRRSPLEKVLIGVLIGIATLFAWHFLTSGNATDDAISAHVKSSMQHSLDTDANLAEYHLVVTRVAVVKQTGNQYQGMATVRGPEGIDHPVPINVTADGDNVIWQSEPGAFAWAPLEQPHPAAPEQPHPEESEQPYPEVPEQPDIEEP